MRLPFLKPLVSMMILLCIIFDSFLLAELIKAAGAPLFLQILPFLGAFVLIVFLAELFKNLKWL